MTEMAKPPILTSISGFRCDHPRAGLWRAEKGGREALMATLPLPHKDPGVELMLSEFTPASVPLTLSKNCSHVGTAMSCSMRRED